MGSETKEIAVTVKKNTDAKIEFANLLKVIKETPECKNSSV